MAEDYYQRLGVSKTASDDEVKKAYRRLAKKLHPDLNPGNKKAEDEFKKVSHAFDVLGDKKKRKLYDEFGDDAEKMGFDEKKAEAFRQYRSGAGGMGGMGGMPGGMNFDFSGQGGDFEEILREMLSNMGRSGGTPRGARGGPMRGEDIQASLQIAFEDAVRGAEKQIELNGRRLTVKIPAGVDTGSRIRLAGQGTSGHRGGPSGDLIIETLVAEHPLVTREGQDLYLDLPVTVREATLGADVRVPTFGGGGTVSVKPGTQSGTKMRLKGQGVPSIDGGPKGDLYLVVQVKVPESLDDDGKRALDKLEKAYRSDVRKDLKL